MKRGQEMQGYKVSENRCQCAENVEKKEKQDFLYIHLK
jgi:hypothetical protein